MKKKFYSLLFTAALTVAAAISAQAAASEPMYSYDFATTGQMGEWTPYDANDDDTGWTVLQNYGARVYSYSGANDDYLISPLLQLEAGVSYQVDIAINDYSTNGAKLNVMYGASLDGSGYTDAGAIDTTPGSTGSITFTVPTSGEYRIALHETSDAFISIYVENIQVTAIGGGDTPAETADMPYFIDFSSSADGWTAVNVDGDSYTWGEDPTYGGYAVTRTNNGSNDWFVSPLFHFEEGEKYQVDVILSTFRGVTDVWNGAQQIKVMFGDNEYTPANQLCTATGYLLTDMQATASVEFEAPATGDYPISVVNNLGGNSSSDVYISSFSLKSTSGQGGGSTELSLPYKYDYAANSIGDWSTLDANGDDITWHSSSIGAQYGICCREGSTGLGDDDDYIVSPGTFALEQGKVYTATLSIGSFSTVSTTADNNKIDIVYGTDDDFTAYQSAGSFKLDDDVKQSGTTTLNFSVSESGSYRIGLHNASSQAVWYITAIDIAEYSAPELPEGVLLDKDFNDGVDMGWTILDENADENPWQFVDGIDGISLPAKRGSQGNHNDWLISPAMTLEGGKAYVVSYTLVASTNNAPATVVAAYGTDATAAAMTTTIATESIENETITHYYRITPAANGTYYLGFQASSAAGGNGTVSVVAVKVAESEGITPLAPTELTAEPSIKAGTVALSWTNPTMDTENIALDGNITLRIVRNGETVDNILGQPGGQMNYTDRPPTPFEGEASYQVIAYVDESRLSEAATATATLDDFQGERSELIFWGQHRNEDYTSTNYEPFSDWAVSDLDGNKSFTYQSWDNSFSLGMATSNNDWIISPAVELSTNRRYLIEVELQSSTAYGATLDVYMGTSATTAAMNSTVMQIDNATGNGWFVLSSEQFDIDENGEYYFGIHCNTRTQTTVYVHGFRIYYYENRDTDPEEVPYTEDFADADLAGWSFADGSTFAVAGGALTSSQNGEPRSEIVYSPLINLKGGYTYEVTFDYAFDGADDGSTFTFYMADGQSETELIADSRLALDGTADGRCLFTPDEDGSYCLAWQIIAGADDDVKATIDNLAVGVNIYSALPYSEDFEGFAINEIPVGYKGITTVSDDNGNIAAEVANAGGSTLWFNYEELRETYSLTLKYKKSDISGWKINAVTAEGEKQLVGSIEGDANADWKEVTFAIPKFDSEEPYGFYIRFETPGKTPLLIDDLQITQNVRAIAPAAPYNFRVYSNGTAAWNYPKTEADGYDLESATNVTVTIYDGDKELSSSTGTPGSNGIIENLDFDDEWENDVKLIRATASVEGELGQSATWIIRKNDNSSWEYNGNILGIAEFGIDDKWQNNGWTIADGKATITEGEGSIVSPEFELKEGQIYLVRYYIDTDADAAADFSVKVGDASQTFTGARIGRNTYDWGGALPDAVGQYQYIDFVLPRIESTDDYNVTISAGNIGKSVSVDLVEIYEVREYPSTCEVPYENDFEDLAVELGGLDPNWSRPYNTNYWRIDDMSNYGTTAASGNRALVAPATTDLDVTGRPEDFVYTPYFVIEAGKTYSIEFDYYMPSAQTGLAFIYAYTPTYTEGEYKIIEEMGQATEWKHYSKTFSVEGADGTFIFGFVSYAAEVRDQAMAIDNFKIFEKQSGSVSEIAAGAAVTYHDGMLNVPADIESVAVYDMQGRMVISTTETGTISLEGLSDGVYVVKAVGTEGGAVQTLKIVK